MVAKKTEPAQPAKVKGKRHVYTDEEKAMAERLGLTLTGQNRESKGITIIGETHKENIGKVMKEAGKMPVLWTDLDLRTNKVRKVAGLDAVARRGDNAGNIGPMSIGSLKRWCFEWVQENKGYTAVKFDEGILVAKK